MSWSTFKSSGGNGELFFRLVVEGCPDVWTNAEDLVGTHSDGREWRLGLSFREAFVLEERVHLQAAMLEVSSTTFTIDERFDGYATVAFARRPQTLAYLTSDADENDTTFNVSDTAAFAEDDFVHIGTECVQVTAVGTNTIDVTRARWDTQAQAHYAASGDGVGYAPITDRPVTLRNRRVLLYVYEASGDLIGTQPAGTLIWRGRVAKPPILRDSVKWQLLVDNIASVLKQELAQTADAPITIRGIHYSWAAPLTFYLFERNGDSRSDSYGTLGNGETFHVEHVSGFFESEVALCQQITVSLNFAIAAFFDGTDARVTAYPDPNGGIILQIEPDPADVRFIDIGGTSPIDGGTGQPAQNIDGSGPVTTMVANGTYYLRFSEELSYGRQIIGPPRAYLGEFVEGRADGFSDPYSTVPTDILYLANDPGLEVGDALTVETGGEENESRTFRVTAVDTGDRSVRLDIPSDFGMVVDGSTEFRATFSYASGGDLADFRDALVDEAPFANRGAHPHITAQDVASWTTQVGRAAADRRYGQRRRYAFSKPKEVSEILAEEAKLLGGFFRLDSAGKVDFRQLSVAVPTQLGTAVVLNDSNILARRNGSPVWPTWAQEADGIANVVEVHHGYNAAEDEHAEYPYTVRDTASISVFKSSERLEVKPYSELQEVSFSWEDARQIAEPLLHFFGRPYEIVVLDVNWSVFDTALCGSTVAITNDHIPDSETGERGVESKVGIVIGRRWEFAGHGQLTVMLHRTNIGGYAPSLRVTAASFTSGTTWVLTVDQIYFADSFDGDTAHFAVGDYVIVSSADSWTPRTGTGVVTAKSATTISIEFDTSAPWSLAYGAGDVYVVRFRDDATGYTPTSTQEDYVYVADSSVRLYDGRTGRVFAP